METSAVVSKESILAQYPDFDWGFEPHRQGEEVLLDGEASTQLVMIVVDDSSATVTLRWEQKRMSRPIGAIAGQLATNFAIAADEDYAAMRARRAELSSQDNEPRPIEKWEQELIDQMGA